MWDVVKIFKHAIDEGDDKTCRKLIPGLNKAELQQCLRYASRVRKRDPIGQSDVCITQKGKYLKVYRNGEETTNHAAKENMGAYWIKTFGDNLIAFFHTKDTLNKSDLVQGLDRLYDMAKENT